MHIFTIKSLLSLVIVFSALVAMFTMFEIFGRSEKRFNSEKLKKTHRLNGIIFLAFAVAIAFLCLDFIVKTKAEPSPRAALHGVFALAVFILLMLKIAFVRFYRQFYGQVQTLGLLIALLTLGMVGTSGGYYLLVRGFAKEIPVSVRQEQPKEEAHEPSEPAVRTDAESIARGKELYESKCSFCHDAYSNETVVGPGHKGILKNPLLPVSKKPATPDNAANQIRNPYKDMPSFSYLSEDDVQNVVAYLNTL
ncbi:MAG: cytochrome c [Nitrospirota bacterium]|nr:cytochrome c [Nitrospirota bacterium]